MHKMPPLIKITTMANYSDLQVDNFYLVIENEGEDVVLIQPLLETDNCVLLMHHDDDETTFWRKKHDQLFEIVDELTDEQAEEYERLFDSDDDFEIE